MIKPSLKESILQPVFYAAGLNRGFCFDQNALFLCLKPALQLHFSAQKRSVSSFQPARPVFFAAYLSSRKMLLKVACTCAFFKTLYKTDNLY